MKVADVMSRQVEYVGRKTSVKNVCRLIFGRGINGVPVLDYKKIVGFITERDVLAKLYPSIEEYIEDPVNMANFETMEYKVAEVFKLPVEKIMSRNPITVTSDTPLLRAQSLMFVHKVGRLPVTDEEGNLVGILSKGDIFKAIVGDHLPIVSDEEYHDWISRQYDLVVDWGQRLPSEIPDLVSLFKKHKVKKVLDIGCGTGEHDIWLAKKGFYVFGIERSRLMYGKAQEKKNKLPANVKKKVDFMTGDYHEILKDKQNEFDCVIFMGNALAQNLDWEELLKSTSKSLRKNNAVIVLQMTNLEKILKANKRLQDFNIRFSKGGQNNELAFIEFFDPPRKKGEVNFNMAILEFVGKRWAPKAINNAPVAVINENNIKEALRKLGFKKFSFYGSREWGPFLKNKFEPLGSDRFNVVAIR